MTDHCDHASPPLAADGDCDGTWAIKKGRIVCSECDLDYGSIELAEVASFGPAMLTAETVMQPNEDVEPW